MRVQHCSTSCPQTSKTWEPHTELEACQTCSSINFQIWSARHLFCSALYVGVQLGWLYQCPAVPGRKLRTWKVCGAHSASKQLLLWYAAMNKRNDWMLGWKNGSTSEWLSDWVTGWLTDWLNQWISESVWAWIQNDWMIWMQERMNDWIDKLVTGWLSDYLLTE